MIIILLAICAFVAWLGKETGLFSSQYSLNEIMDFGDFTLYFDEEVSDEKEYILGKRIIISPNTSDNYLYGLSGHITAKNYISLDDIHVKMKLKFYVRESEVGYVAVKDVPQIYFREKVFTLSSGESAFIHIGCSFDSNVKEGSKIEHFIIEYKDTDGNNYSYIIKL